MLEGSRVVTLLKDGKLEDIDLLTLLEEFRGLTDEEVRAMINQPEFDEDDWPTGRMAWAYDPTVSGTD